MQQAATHVAETAQVEDEVLVGGFQGAVAVVQQAADVEQRAAAGAQGAQLARLVVDASGGDAQGAVAFDHAVFVVERAAEAEVDLLPADLAVGGTAVVEVMGGDPDLAGGVQAAVLVVEIAGADYRVAGLRGDAAAVVVQAGAGDGQALRLHAALLAGVGQVVAVFQGAGELRREGALLTGEGAAAAVEVDGVDRQVAGLCQEGAALVVDVARGGDGQRGLALQGAAAVGQPGGAEVEVGVLAVDQAVGVVLHHAGGGNGQGVVGGDGAAVAVVQAAGEQGQQGLAGQLAVLVVDLGGALDQQVGAGGELAVGVGQYAQQVEGASAVAGDAAVAVVEGGAGEGEGVLRGDGAGVVGQADGLQGQAGGAGENAGAVVEVAGADVECAMADQRAIVAVEQVALHRDGDVAVTAGDGAAVAVVQAARRDGHALPAGHQAAGVEQAVGVKHQQVVADQLAAGVVQVTAGQGEALAAGQFTVLVIEVAQVADGQLASGGDQAAGVVEVAGSSAEIQGDGATQQVAAGAVVDGGGVDGQGAVGVDQAQVVVGQLAADVQREVALAVQGATGVVQAARLHVQAGGGDGAVEVAQGVIDRDRQGLVGEQFAVVVDQAVGAEIEGLGAGDFAAAVVHRADILQYQHGGGDQAALVAQGAVVEVQGQGAVAEQLAALVVDGTRGGQAQLASAGQAAQAVGQAGGAGGQQAFAAEQAASVSEVAGQRHRQVALGFQMAVAVVQATALELRLGRADHPALVVEQIGLGGQLAAGNDTAGVADRLRAQAHITAAVATVVAVDPGFDDAAVAQLAAAAQGDGVAGGEVLTVVEVARGGHVQMATGVDRAVGGDALGSGFYRPAGRHLGHVELAIGVQFDVTGAGGQVAGQVHAHALLGAHQFDGAGVHAAQGGGVDGQVGLGAAVIGARGGVQGAGVNVVATGDHGQLVGIDLRVDAR